MPKVKNGLTCGVDCKLSSGCRRPFIQMEGNPATARVLFVGEAPGESEDRMGLNFVGDAGKLLRETLQTHKIEDYCITNAVRCRPPKNRTPSAREVQACKQLLKADIASIPNLELIVPLGNVALGSLLRNKSITKLSGKLMDGPDGHKYLPILHPAYVLRNRNELKTFEEHIGRIHQAMTGSLLDPSDFGAYSVIDTVTKWESLMDRIIDKGYFVYDIETTSVNPFKDNARMRCIGFSVEEGTGEVLPLDPDIWTEEQWDKIYNDLHVIFSSKRIGKVGHNVKFDNLWMEEVLGIPVNYTIWDTKHSQFLLNENESNELKDMAWKYTKIGGYERLLEAEPQVAEKDLLYTYCATDCDVTHRIFLVHQRDLPKELRYLMDNLMLPAMNTLLKMERKGIKIDTAKLDICEKLVEVEISKHAKAIKQQKSVQDYEQANGEFNPNSYLQLGEILFKYEGLQPVSYTKKTKRPSTNREVLEELAHQSPLARVLVDYSVYQSMKSKMIKELREYEHKERIHTFYLQTRAVTGRTSSKSPNMQNVTKGDKDVVGIRKVFVADPQFSLVEFDYNQHELRCMAEEAGDDTLARAITTSDVHASTAGSILGKDPSEVTSDERRTLGKCMNPNMLIYTNSRYKYIGEGVSKYEHVYDGTYYPGTASYGQHTIGKFHHMGKKKQRIIVFRKGIIVCGEDHWVQTHEGLKEAKNLTNLDEITESRYPPVGWGPSDVVKISPFWNSGIKTASLELDDKWAYFAGVFMGDGCYTSDHSASISCGVGGKYEKWKEQIVDACQAIGLEPKVHKGKCYTVYLGSRHVTKLLREIGLGTKKGKSFVIPTWVWANEHIAKHFIAGLIDTDGYISHGGYGEIVTKDPVFASGISCMLQALGLHVSVAAKYNNQYVKYYYRVHFQGEKLAELKALCNCSWKNKNLGRSRDCSRARVGNQVLLNMPYKSEELVDLSINSPLHLYWCAGAITHNTFNFGLIYGLTVHGVIRRLKCSEVTAQMYIDKFFKTYPKTKAWIDATASFAKENGYVRSRTGRVRHFPIWDDLDDKSIREAINMPIQSLASDILLYGMVGVDMLLRNKKSYLCLEVHDSVVCAIHEDEMDLVPQIRDVLINACKKHIRFVVPLQVDIKIGPNWGEMVKYD
jgi:uracil-DNA glycosylase family 4